MCEDDCVIVGSDGCTWRRAVLRLCVVQVRGWATCVQTCGQAARGTGPWLGYVHADLWSGCV